LLIILMSLFSNWSFFPIILFSNQCCFNSGSFIFYLTIIVLILWFYWQLISLIFHLAFPVYNFSSFSFSALSTKILHSYWLFLPPLFIPHLPHILYTCSAFSYFNRFFCFCAEILFLPLNQFVPLFSTFSFCSRTYILFAHLRSCFYCIRFFLIFLFSLLFYHQQFIISLLFNFVELWLIYFTIHIMLYSDVGLWTY
jgi:hypothetical protein